MGEPLFDMTSAAIVVLGTAAVAFMHSSTDDAVNAQRRRRLSVVGHALLGLAVSLLLYRWVGSVTSLPANVQPNFWRSGSLCVSCGIGIIAAFKAVLSPTPTLRGLYFVISVTSSAVALMIASAWDWALLLLALLAAGIALTLRNTADVSNATANEEANGQQEPGLVTFFSAGFLLLLLGTWQHVIQNETHRQTRSPRYSAWPRATALRDAWERTGWNIKPEDAKSAEQVERAYFDEQRIALPLAALLLIVALLPRRLVRQPSSESDHAS